MFEQIDSQVSIEAEMKHLQNVIARLGLAHGREFRHDWRWPINSGFDLFVLNYMAVFLHHQDLEDFVSGKNKNLNNLVKKHGLQPLRYFLKEVLHGNLAKYFFDNVPRGTKG